MNLQPLNICMSYQGTLNLIEKISEDHDVEVQYWCDQMKDLYFQKVKKLHSFTGFLLEIVVPVSPSYPIIMPLSLLHPPLLIYQLIHLMHQYIVQFLIFHYQISQVILKKVVSSYMMTKSKIRVLSPYLFQKQETTSVTNSLVTMWIKMLDHLENVQK